MSSAGASPRGRRAGDLTRRASSIARSIARSSWLRRLGGFALLDMLLAAVLAGAFWANSLAQLPDKAHRFLSLAPGYTCRVACDEEAAWSTTWWDPNDWTGTLAAAAQGSLVLMVEAPNGDASWSFPFAPVLSYALPVGGTLAAAEVAALVSGAFETRRIRRKLKPLNDLALAAEAIGSVAGTGGRAGAASETRAQAAGEPATKVKAASGAAPGSASGGAPGPTATQADSAGKFTRLEHAIEAASPLSPIVTTGDKDLRSIEVALNGLLHRMQEARAEQTRFVSDASHELRTPIAVIQGYVGMLDRWGKTDPAVLDESIAALKSESAHMKELVDQLLFLARGDSGRQALTREPLDVQGLVEELVEESALIDNAHRYRVDGVSGCGVGAPGTTAGTPRAGALSGSGRADGACEAPGLPGLPAVQADRALIKQCLRIIVQNAARYSEPSTTVRVGVLVQESDTDGTRRVGLYVRDEGMGISEEDARHVFERFYRADAARDEHKDGTGLGLAIAKWIAEAHDGTIEVVSVPAIGTRFTLWLPAN